MSVLTQLDYWSFIVELCDFDVLVEMEEHENRKVLKSKDIRIMNPRT